MQDIPVSQQVARWHNAVMVHATSCVNWQLGFLRRAVAERDCLMDTKVRTHLQNLRGEQKFSRSWRSVSWPGGFLDAARAARLKPGLLSG
jgi:hypothetical protein